MQTTLQDVAGLERKFLRSAWWLFPLLGLAVAMLFARYGWWIVSLDDALINRDAMRAFKMPCLLFVPAFALVPAFWWLALQRGAGRQRAGWLMALAAVIACDGLIRSTSVQQALLLAMNFRCMNRVDGWQRDIANLRLNAMDDRAGDARRVLFAGTSQLKEGIDYEQAQRDLPAFKICNRAIPGMVPLRICAAQKFLPARSNDVVVLYLSEFDLDGQAALDVNWLRPTAGIDGARDVMASLRRDMLLNNWRGLADYTAAAVSELWRSRDVLRTLVLNLAGKPVQNEAGGLYRGRSLKQWGDVYRARVQEREFWTANLDALERLLAKWSARGARVVVFEGQLNPEIVTADSRVANGEACRDLSLLIGRHGGVFVPVRDQPLQFAASDFRDFTHLNGAARERFTAYVTGWLRDKTSKDWK